MSAAAAKLLQSCPTLCDPIDGSPLGSPVPGFLQARILEWVAISFSNAWKWKVKGKSLSRVRLLAIPWTAAYQAPPSMGFSKQEYWSVVPSPSPWNVPLVSLIFLKRSLIFRILLFPCISLHWSLRKAFLSLLAILWNSAFIWCSFPFLLCLLLLFFSQKFVRSPQTIVLPLCNSFSWGWFWSLPPVQCHKPLSTVLQALCLSRKSVLNTQDWILQHQDWCWSWSSNTLATWCKELTP